MAGSRLRRHVLVVALGLLAAASVTYASLRTIAFARLFGLFRPHSGIRITQGEITAAYETSTDPRTPVVPRIIHQIFHNWHDPNGNTLRPDWKAARQTCLDLNPSWEHMLWTSKTSRDFIEEEFPWFLSAYDRYSFPVQKVDVVKYFVLRYYGGIYIDLDNGCAANLEPLTYYPAFTTDGGHGALSNNIMGGQPGHPLFFLLTDNLIRWQVNYLLPYATIMWSSGQWYFTAIWEEYHSVLTHKSSVNGISETRLQPLHHILMDMRPGSDPWVFFTQVDGNSWANWDNRLISIIGDNIAFIMLLLVALVSSTGWACAKTSIRRNNANTAHKLFEA
ncbi:mannosyl phosphorylinositol ceramide synthase CSH1 [Penicillium argentinense]|uniref:Mannosyl phosphorylinositol ceramide synthase CSH1 n=1 Tax=Penicillium argentinense TaxID=1131581 RepID=A0A9W9K2G5_9EURO|nr:mannosyl phosphorylinositol ceramide synthase CSH1 [Penicillium argentinense]KAJ5089702.1 mannosyl phosphorylinositol ceramide synthase CSH1 [Penicillium argentinense]